MLDQRSQVKAETEAEQKINNSYQGLYKQVGVQELLPPVFCLQSMCRG